jgi:hypothetical protein
MFIYAMNVVLQFIQCLELSPSGKYDKRLESKILVSHIGSCASPFLVQMRSNAANAAYPTERKSDGKR